MKRKGILFPGYEFNKCAAIRLYCTGWCCLFSGVMRTITGAGSAPDPGEHSVSVMGGENGSSILTLIL